jgi:hypothetical protein
MEINVERTEIMRMPNADHDRSKTTGEYGILQLLE